MRSKASSESTALAASLRKEQMKNESLEQALLHKVTGHSATFACLASVRFFVTLRLSP